MSRGLSPAEPSDLNGRQVLKRIRAVAGIGLLLTALIATTATPSYAHAPSDFAAQARAAGLTGAEAKSLQQRVDTYLARAGGTQVAMNKINLDGKGEILLALPGEQRAGEGSGAGVMLEPCREGNFCGYSEEGWHGDILRYYYCAYKLTMPFAGFGSYINNQTGGATAHFYDWNGTYMYDSLVPGYMVYTFNWSVVYYIKPCGSI
jgi:hypothetical protein